ncbi:auxilin-like protein 1 [Fagus crenata]
MPSQLPPPSWPLPGANVSKGGSSRLIPIGKSVASEGTADDSSPPFFDVEVDASSSAAAMKEAMVKAQAKLRSAKEFMDRKMSKIVDECDSLRDEGLQSNCDREDNGMKFSVREEKQKVMTAQEVLDLVGEKLLKVAKESAEKRLGKKSNSYLGFAKIDGGSEWIEESQFFELVRTDKSDKALEQTNHVQISVHNTKNP